MSDSGAASRSVGGVHPIYESSVGKVREIRDSDTGLALIYVSDHELATLLAQVTSVPWVNFAQRLPDVTPTTGRNSWLIAMRLIAGLKTRTLADVTNRAELHESELYPGRAILVRGSVVTAQSVTPSGFDVSVSNGRARILVDKSQGLHLNQRFLAGQEVWVLGRVLSIPRRQFRAAAVAIRAPERTQSVGAIVGLSSDSASA